MKSTRELLRESPFFETFAPDDIDALAAHATMRDVPAGEVILWENEPAEALFGRAEAAATIAEIDEELDLPPRQEMFLNLIARAGAARASSSSS